LTIFGSPELNDLLPKLKPQPILVPFYYCPTMQIFYGKVKTAVFRFVGTPPWVLHDVSAPSAGSVDPTLEKMEAKYYIRLVKWDLAASPRPLP
jgi:hypothetical protein